MLCAPIVESFADLLDPVTHDDRENAQQQQDEAGAADQDDRQDTDEQRAIGNLAAQAFAVRSFFHDSDSLRR